MKKYFVRVLNPTATEPTVGTLRARTEGEAIKYAESFGGIVLDIYELKPLYA